MGVYNVDADFVDDEERDEDAAEDDEADDVGHLELERARV